MSSRTQINQSEKMGLHPRNPHRFGYNFQELIFCCKGLKPFVFINQYGNESIDFANPAAVKALNKALLIQFYEIKHWDIPANYLCPPIPGRADYIHHIADLLASDNEGVIPRGESIVGLDIGLGANCVYPIIGVKEYGWRFVGSDIDKKAIDSAQRIVDSNPILTNRVEIRLQQSSDNIFRNIVRPDEKYAFTVCNPPFHASAQEAAEKSNRKLVNLGLRKGDKVILNFGGMSNELWYKGGEEAFLQKMIVQSAEIPKQCFWFTSLVSKSATLPPVYKALKTSNALEIQTIKMAQGQKVSRFVAWTFLTDQEQKEWQDKRWK
ncbi:MAG: 23S rRNA (adenine(1618)-N(6))-methyltransferase RlmF [Bacteroidales bacterium]|nr:MAG: 23S rRNA (adenine(1618)-N(6))-methyltransferase RlmF [Bacteroidales bacterium]